MTLEEMFNRLLGVSEADQTDEGVPTSVWEEFVNDYERLLAFATTIRDALVHGEDLLEHGAVIRSDFAELVHLGRTALNELENPS